MKEFLTFIFLILSSSPGFCQTWEVYNSSNSEIPSDDVTGFAVGEDGKIWISTMAGIASFDNQWQQHEIYKGILGIWSFKNLIWIGSENYGLWSFDGSSDWISYHTSSIGIVGCGISSKDSLWILSNHGDFSKWNGNSWDRKTWGFNTPTGLFIDSHDNIWILSASSGLIKYKDGIWTGYNHYPDGDVYGMVEDSKGNYWIGSGNKGLFKFDGETFTNFDTSNSDICSNKIRALAINENDVLWIGTGDGGVSKFDGQTWTNYNTKNSPLSSNLINAIAVGKDGKIWISHGYNYLLSPSGGKGIVVLKEDDNSEVVEPSAPSDLNLKGISETQVIINWSDNSNNESGFIIERSANSQNDFQQIKFINQNTTSFTDFTVSSANTYYYRVAATNSQGLSLFTQTESITPKYCAANPNPSDYNSYASVTEVKFGDIHNKVENSQNGYYEYLDQYTELRPGQTLLMTVSFDRPTWTSAETIKGSIYVDWNADGDFEDESEKVFQDLAIQRKGPFVFPVHVPENAAEGETRLRTRADDFSGNAGPCGYAEETQDYTLKILPGTQLEKPGELSAKGQSSGSVFISWRDNSSNETGFTILRSLDGSNFDYEIKVNPNTAEYLDTGLNQDADYYYKVAAASGSEITDFSETISAKTLPVDFEKQTSGDISTFRGPFPVGAFWGDYENDGKPDIFLRGRGVLLKNNLNSFINSEVPLKSDGPSAWGDFNNDGFLDLITSWNDWSAGTSKILLYKNSGNGSFTEINPFEVDDRVNSCVWVDINKDGKLDLFLSYKGRENGKLYLNEGNDVFSESFTFDGVSDEVSGFASFADYDNDGDLDLFVVNYYNNNVLYDNNDEGTFSRNTSSLITQFNEWSMGASWGDIDNDGDLDLFISNGSVSEERNSLYINNGDGSFSKITTGAIVNDGGHSYGSAFCDFDNDGNLDLAVANSEQENLLYRGNGDGSFTKEDKSLVMNEYEKTFYDQASSYACAWADFNQDGFPDLFFANSTKENFLYQNSGNSNNWIKLKLVGTKSNRSAIGAKVKIKIGHKIQYRELTTQSGYSGQNEMDVIFGLGKNTFVDSVIISWPSGLRQILTDVSSNQVMEIIEPEGTVLSVEKYQLEVKIFPNPFTEYFTIKGITEGPYNIEITDLNGRVILNKTYQGQTIINTPTLARGFYFIRLIKDEKVIVKKILKE